MITTNNTTRISCSVNRNARERAAAMIQRLFSRSWRSRFREALAARDNSRAVGSEKLTMEGMVVGTAEYLAPEQANGTLRDDLRSDVYSLAILLYEMLTGRVPFRHPSAAKGLIKQVSSPPPPPRTIRPEIPVGIEAALLKALAKKPDARFSSVVEFRDAVEAYGAMLRASDREEEADRLLDEIAPSPP